MSDTVATPNAAWHAIAQDRQLIHDFKRRGALAETARPVAII
jgi:hypothetical protein